MTKLIALTKGYHAIVDDEDFEVLAERKWFAQEVDGIVYAVRTDNKSAVLMHKFLTGFVLTDHINGNGLDNRRVNLRESSPRLNMGNRKKQKGTSSKYKGVHFVKNRLRWQAYIKIHGKTTHLGYFDSEVDAALAYDVAARKYFGEFAALNFPLEGEQSALR